MSDDDVVIKTHSLESESLSDAVEFMNAYDLWRCEHTDGGIQCRQMSAVELGNPPEIQLCDLCASKNAYKRFRVFASLQHSDQLKRDFQACRRRHLSVVAPTPSQGGGQ